MWRLLLLLVVPFVPTIMAASAAAAPGASSWAGFRAAVNQQSLQTVLISIEERLRGLDNLYSARYAPRIELSMEQQSRRLDNIESRLGRLETLMELRLDKLAETLSARQLKEELSKDQMSRKVDSNYERLNHRLGYMEARLDMGMTKLQTTVDAGSSRIERLEMAFGGRHGDVGADIIDVKNGMDELKRVLQGSHNSTMTAVASGESTMKLYYNQLTASLVQIHGELNRTLVQNDGEDPMHRDVEGKVLTTVERHASNFGTKITNMYNELWRRTQTLETVAKDSMSLSNATRRELQEGLRSMSMQMSRYCCLQADRGKPSFLDISLESLGNSLTDVSRKMDTYFQTLITTHEVILQNCHRIQKEEPLIEERLTDVLERILEISRNNRCQNMGQEIQQVHELLKSHHTTVVRNVGHSTNTIMRAADNSSKDNKNLVDVIALVRDGLLASNRNIQDSLDSVQKGQGNVSQVLSEIAATMQEFQEQLLEINSATLDGELGESTTAKPICPDSKMIATDVATVVSKLPGFADSTSTGTLQRNLTRDEMKAFTDMLITELKDKHMHIITEPNTQLLTRSTQNRITDEKMKQLNESLEEFETETNQESIDGDNDDASDEDDEILPESHEQPYAENRNVEQSLQNNISKSEININNNISNISSNKSNLRNSTFESIHRFDVLTYKNIAIAPPRQVDGNTVDYESSSGSFSNNDKEAKSAEVTIKVIPHPQIRTTGNVDPLLQGLGLDNSSTLLEIDLNHVAAIIHSTDTEINGQGPQASVTIVHNDKPVTAEGQVKYSSTVIGAPAELIMKPTISKHNENNTQQDNNKAIPTESPFSHSLNDSGDQNINTSKIEESESTNWNLQMSEVNETLDSYNPEHDNMLLTIPITTTPTTLISNNITAEKTLPFKQNNNHTSFSLQNDTYYTEETTRQKTNQSYTNEFDMHNSESGTDPNSIQSQTDFPEGAIGEFLKTLIEVHDKNKHTNKTIQEILTTLQFYNKQDHKTNNTKNNETIRHHLRTAKSTDDSTMSSVVKSQQGRLVNQSTSEIVDISRTDIEVPIRHYVSKLEELATRLARVGKNTEHKVINTTDSEHYFNHPTDHTNKNQSGMT